jgi:nucleoside diphosphate kinase
MKELAYVLVNPYTVSKSRTGGVLSRLLSRSSQLSLIGVRMFAPSAELVNEYVDALVAGISDEPERREIEELLVEYVRGHYMPDNDGRRRRVMFLIVEGENAVEHLREGVVGSIIRQTVGETIRDTYGDYILDKQGRVAHFEPAVLIARTAEEARRHIDIWVRHSAQDSGVLYDAVAYPPDAQVEHTLVMIKPDTFGQSRTRPGTVVDLFSKTGLCIIAAKVVHLTVSQALEFYSPVREVFYEKFRGRIREQLFEALEGAFECQLPVDGVEQLVEELRRPFADCEFGKIVQFMTGRNPWETPRDKWDEPSRETCLALVYQGHCAVSKIREQLGSTDPSKAAPTTVRKEFGQDIMVNTAHASDSRENAEREIAIVDMPRNDLPELLAQHDRQTGR